MKMILKIVIPIYIVFGIFACAPVRTVVPLKKSETHVSAALGGPLIEFSDLIIPIPLTSVNVAHGLSNSTTLNSALHTTSMLFGVVQIESSVTHQFYYNEKFKSGLSISPGFYFMIDTWEWNPKLYPLLDINFYKMYGKKNHFLYLSYSQMFELASEKAFQEKVQSFYIPYLSLGHTWNRTMMNYTLEFRYLNFFQSNQNIVVDYISAGNKGAFGIQFGLTRKF